MEVDPVLKAYLLNIAIMTGVLAGAGLVFVLLLGGLVWLLRYRWGGQVSRALWLSVVGGVTFVVIGVSLFDGIAGLFRYREPGYFYSGYRQFESYFVWARTAFFALNGLALLLGSVIGYAIGHRLAGRGRSISVATVVALLVILFAILPIVDFANACVVGKPFILPTSC